MSDTSQGPGWWLASDGKWYPPEQWTGPPNTGPPSTGTPTGAPAQPWGTDLGAASGATTPLSEQPGPTWPQASTGQGAELGVEGPPPAYGANQGPGSAPPAEPGYGANPYGQPAYGAPPYNQPTQPGYGAPYGVSPYGQPAYAPGGASTNGLAIAAFVCSIVGIFFITFIVAIILGFVARAQIRSSGGRQKGDGFALAAVIIGFAWLAFYVIIFIAGAVGNNSNSSVISLLGVIGHVA
jgi:Domain of unknown function (DUF4190)